MSDANELPATLANAAAPDPTRRKIVAASAAVGAIGALGFPAVHAQSTVTLRILNNETSVDSNRALRVAAAEYERKYRTRYEVQADGSEVAVKVPYDERKLLTAPVIQSALGANFQITGLDSQQESSELALMLRAGALAAPISFVEERTVDVHIRRLRKALEPSNNDALIQTVRGTGYRFSTHN